MSFEMYKKEGIEFPYLIDTRYEKSTSEGVVKEKYERRWVVLISEINAFIKSLALSYNELALASVTRDDRGAISVVTAIYGEAGLSDEFLDKDGELTWWTLSNGVYTYHIKRWVNNNPNDIKDFCNYCKSSYGYENEEVSVSCNPVAGESRVMCEATFSRAEEEVESGGSGDGEGESDGEDEEKEEANGIQVSSSLQEISLDPIRCIAKNKKLDMTGKEFLIAQEVESGKLVYRESGDFGGAITESGWYDATDDNPQAWNKVKYSADITPETIMEIIEMKKRTYTAIVPCIHVSLSTKKTASDKITLSNVSNSMSEVGTESETLSKGGISLTIPKSLEKVKTSLGDELEARTNWLYEGCSFDGGSVRVKTKSKLTTSANGQAVRESKKYYEGTIVHSFRTVTRVYDGCSSYTEEQAI